MFTENTSTPGQAHDIDVAALRHSLEQQLEEREGIVRELAPRATPNDDPIAYATSVRTRRVMDQIRAALARLDAGTYGSCTRCKNAIAPARLEVLPYAETCITCQSELDSA